MKTVLITRPEPGATETASRVSALGLRPVIAPVLSIQSLTIGRTGAVSAVVLTSRNAIPACSSVLRRCPVFAVGTATAAAASSAGFNDVFNADGDAVALAALIVKNFPPSGGSLLLPTGRGQGIDLAALLRAQGFRVQRRVAYHARIVDNLPECAVTLLHRRQLQSALFFSGETSRHFVTLMRAAALAEAVVNVEAVSISERAAVPLRALQWRCLKVAAKPNQEAMLELLEHD